MISKMFFLVSIVIAQSSLAKKSCLFEGDFTLYGQKVIIKDCASNQGISDEDFKKMCSQMSQAAVQLGAPPAQIKYLASCPGGQQGVCKSFKKKKVDFYYYKRDPETLKATKA